MEEATERAKDTAQLRNFQVQVKCLIVHAETGLNPTGYFLQ